MNHKFPLDARLTRYQFVAILAYAAIYAAALAVAYQYVTAEKVFYFWDSFAYNRSALESLDSFRQSFGIWTNHIHNSIQSGFSQVYTIPLAPLMDQFGETRAIYILGIVGFYLLPFVTVSTLLARNLVARMSPLSFVLSFCGCLAVPVIWHASLRGYPDIGGLVLAWLAILVYFGDRSLIRWRSVLAIGVLLSGTFLFRRHLAYVVIPLLALMTLFSISRALKDVPMRPVKSLLILGLKFTIIVSIIIGSLALIAPLYLKELSSTSYSDLYKPFQNPVLQAAKVHFNWIGSVYWIAAALGFGLGLRDPIHRWKSAFLICYTILSFSIWVLYLRYTSIQHNLHFAGMVACGVGTLVAFICQAPEMTRKHPTKGFILVCLLLGLWGDRLAFWSITPTAIEISLPSKLPPRVDVEYDEIKRMTEYLHTLGTDSGQVVLFDSSSQLLNSDMISIAEKTLYGRSKQKMNILYGGHMDTIAPYPLRDMLAANWIVHTEPFLWHINVQDQGVVEAIYRAFTDNWEFTKDFEVLPQSFHLQHNANIRIYHRIRQTDFPTTVDTVRRVFDTVGISNAWNGPFMIGDTSTGAEYYDARLIARTSVGHFRLDLSQVRFREDQSVLTLFVRTTESATKHLRGDIRGADLDITAEMFPDENLGTTSWRIRQSCADGADIDIVYPSAKDGVLALTLTPRKKPPAGVPLGLQVENLRISEK